MVPTARLPLSSYSAFLRQIDEDTKTKDPSQVPVGPVTRARAKRFKEELNNLVYRVLKTGGDRGQH